MVDAILYSILFVLFFFAYVLAIRLPIHKRNKSIKRYRKWFLLALATAFFIVVYLMDTEQDLIPRIGYIFLIGLGAISGSVVLSALAVSPEERSADGKKLLKLSFWVLIIVIVLAVIWISIWWKKIYS